jgi:hypothetical protein
MPTMLVDLPEVRKSCCRCSPPQLQDLELKLFLQVRKQPGQQQSTFTKNKSILKLGTYPAPHYRKEGKKTRHIDFA